MRFSITQDRNKIFDRMVGVLGYIDPIDSKKAAAIGGLIAKIQRIAHLIFLQLRRSVNLIFGDHIWYNNRRALQLLRYYVEEADDNFRHPNRTKIALEINRKLGDIYDIDEHKISKVVVNSEDKTIEPVTFEKIDELKKSSEAQSETTDAQKTSTSHIDMGEGDKGSVIIEIDPSEKDPKTQSIQKIISDKTDDDHIANIQKINRFTPVPIPSVGPGKPYPSSRLTAKQTATPSTLQSQGPNSVVQERVLNKEQLHKHLAIAVKKNSFKEFKTLLDHPLIDINFKLANGETLLYYACLCSKFNSHDEMINLLLDRGANVNCIIEVQSGYPFTPYLIYLFKNRLDQEMERKFKEKDFISQELLMQKFLTNRYSLEGQIKNNIKGIKADQNMEGWLSEFAKLALQDSLDSYYKVLKRKELEGSEIIYNKELKSKLSPEAKDALKNLKLQESWIEP